MLRWSHVPTKAFDRIVLNALDMAKDMIKDDVEEGTSERLVGWYGSGMSRRFSASLFVAACNHLIEAIESPKVWVPTEYHFYLLYHVLEVDAGVEEGLMSEGQDFAWFRFEDEDMQELFSCVAEEGGDVLAREAVKEYCEYPTKAFDWVVDSYFWDTDFLFDAGAFNSLPGPFKKQMSISEGTFGVVNDLEACPEDLHMKEHEQINT